MFTKPVLLYGSNISYFTGKLENYFRIREIPYQLQSMQAPRDFKRVEQAVGVSQMPALELPDGRWMTDSTKTIQWFEQQLAGPSLIPEDAQLRYLCLLIEDYADEWLWRPAMHFRWYSAEGAHFASRHLAEELMGGIPLPGFFKRWMMRRRQRSGYTTGDGITSANRAQVERIYYRLLEQLETILSQRDFLLGDRPSLADIGLSGPFFRHFALDPVPLEILRQTAPSVLAWVARLWSSRHGSFSGEWRCDSAEVLAPLLSDIATHYLPYLNANVDAVRTGNKHFDVTIDGAHYKRARVSRYRVWCLHELRRQFDQFSPAQKASLQPWLQQTGIWQPLWQQADLPMFEQQESGLPFRADTKMLAVNE